jgi:uncharacterized protein (UPF0248 family)
MPAPKFSTVYQFEDAIESAVKSSFNLSNLNCFAQRDGDTVGTPRTFVQFTSGAASDHLSKLLSDGSVRQDMFRGTLQIGIVTNRKNDTANDHSDIRGTVREILNNFQITITEALLPYHKILRVSETGSTPQVSTEDDHDISQITFDITFIIRPEAWP